MNDTDAYICEIQTLKLKYAGQIELYLGMEIDYLTADHNPSSPFFQNLPLDYRIGSVHLLENICGQLEDMDVSAERFQKKIMECFGGDLKAAVIAYFDKLMRMVEAGGFDIIGHADKISMNASFCQPDITEQRWYHDKIREYFTLVAEKEVMMEINTKAYAHTGFFFPNRRHFDLIRELGIPVQVNSDAHFPEKINDGRAEALMALKAYGIPCVRELLNGKWQDVAIR